MTKSVVGMWLVRALLHFKTVKLVGANCCHDNCTFFFVTLIPAKKTVGRDYKRMKDRAAKKR